jgi:hypothetical protein
MNGPTALCWALASLSLFFSFVMFFTQTVGFLRRVISPSQGRYLLLGQDKHRINAHTDIHALSGIRAQDPSVGAGEVPKLLIRKRYYVLFLIPVFIVQATKLVQFTWYNTSMHFAARVRT